MAAAAPPAAPVSSDNTAAADTPAAPVSANNTAAANTATDPISLVKTATETYVGITGQGDQQMHMAGEQLSHELDMDKTLALWKSHADGSGDQSVGEGRSAVYRWAASKMGEDAKFEDVAASVAAALKNEK